MFKKLKYQKQVIIDKSSDLETVSIKEGLGKSLQENISLFQKTFHNDETLIIREFQNRWSQTLKCCIMYIDGMINTELINDNIIQPILGNDLSNLDINNLLVELKTKVIVSNNVTMEKEINKMIGAITYGDTLLLIEGFEQTLIIDTKGWQTRSIDEPESAKVVRGPREGFTESILMNLSMVRRKIQNPDLKFQFKDIGERTHTKTCICYLEDLVMEGILDELVERLDHIEIDGIMDSGYIQELIKDAPYSPFDTVGASERPDVIAAKLLEGRVAIFVDGSPFVLTVPYLIVESLQANEDYYTNYIYSSINRLIRGATAVFTIMIPALYLSLVTYHQEMIPTTLLLNISASKQDVPFPTSVSLFVMLLIFDILRESGTRMPSSIGQAVNIVGTLVLGQAAVEARLVSAPVIIITAITGITTLLNMNLIGPTIIYRNFLLLGAALLGMYGFIFCFIILYLHLMSIRSFGVPYLMSITRVINHNGQDAWIRAPWWSMTLRPKIFGNRNVVRESPKKSRVK